MADELRRLEELNNQLRLVGRGNDVAEMQRFCSAFTNEAARLLWSEGWRRIRKPWGQNVDGLDIDKLVNANTFQLVDIIVSAGASNARVAWQVLGAEFPDTSRFVEVKPIEVSPLPSPSPAPPAPAPDELTDAIADIIIGREETNRQLNRIAVALEAIAAVLVAAGKRFGLEPTWIGRSE